MTVVRSLLTAFVTFLAPGFGQGLLGRRRLTAAWVAGGVASAFLIIVSIWVTLVLFAVHLAAAVDAFVRIRAARHHRRSAEPPPVAEVGGVTRLPRKWDTPLAVTALVAGVIGVGAIRVVALEAFKIPSSSMYPTLQIDDHIDVDKLSIRWRPPERGEVIVFWQPCMREIAFVKRVIAVGGETVEVRCDVVYVNGKALPSTLVDTDCEYQDRYDDGEKWVTARCSRYRETNAGRSYDLFFDSDRPDRDARRARGEPDPGQSRDFPDGFLTNCANQRDYASTPNQRQQPGKLVGALGEPGSCAPQLHFVVPPDSLFVMGDNRHNANDSRYWGVVPIDLVIGRVIGIWLPFDRIGAID